MGISLAKTSRLAHTHLGRQSSRDVGVRLEDEGLSFQRARGRKGMSAASLDPSSSFFLRAGRLRADLGCALRARLTPVRADGVEGAPVFTEWSAPLQLSAPAPLRQDVLRGVKR